MPCPLFFFCHEERTQVQVWRKCVTVKSQRKTEGLAEHGLSVPTPESLRAG